LGKSAAPEFPNYAAGSDGPIEAEALIGSDHHSWQRLADLNPPKNK